MRDSQAYDKMKSLLGKYGGNVTVLEEEIDIELQMLYFKESKKYKKELHKEQVLAKREELFVDTISCEDKRILLCQLASVDDVLAYRTIEKYTKQPDSSLLEWSKLAYQESKMLLQSSLLDKAPLFISTGLGGKGSNLRYFIVVTSKFYRPFTGTQEKVIRSEFEFIFKKQKAEIEAFECCGYYVTVTGLIPMKTGLKKLFSQIVLNCNELGDFLNTSFIVTNVKRLSHQEIEQAIEKERMLKDAKDKNTK